MLLCAQAHTFELPEKSRRMAYACKCMKLSSAKRFDTASTLRIVQVVETITYKVHAEHQTWLHPRWYGRIVIQYQGMRLIYPRRTLTQWACWQRPSVADAALVNHDDLDVTPQTQMLQSIVSDQHIAVGMGGHERLCSCHAIVTDKDRTACPARQQQWLVADERCIALRRHRLDALHTATKAATDNAGPPATPGQCLHYVKHEGCLSAAASGYVADDNYRHRQFDGSHPPQAICMTAAIH
jgi:hypothetical protein